MLCVVVVCALLLTDVLDACRRLVLCGVCGLLLDVWCLLVVCCWLLIVECRALCKLVREL